VEVVLDSGHGGLLSRANSISLPLCVGTGRIGLVELGTLGVDSADKEADTVWAGHGLSLRAFVALAEVNGQIRYCLGNGFDVHLLRVVEVVVLGLNASMVNQNASVTDNATHRTGAVSVDLH